MHCKSLGTKARHIVQAQPDDRDKGHQFCYPTLGGLGTRVVASWIGDVGSQ
jgi:hypothetical protein